MKKDSTPQQPISLARGFKQNPIYHQAAKTFIFASSVLLLCLMQTSDLRAQSDEAAQDSSTSTTQANDREQKYQAELDRWMLRAYEGDREAQFKVGVLFTNEQFNQPDYEQAVYWYKQAARQGHVLAQYNLGHQYLTGVGVAKNETSAMQWWLKAAQQDHALAQFNIGRAYYLGIGFDQNQALSRKWFERAAANNEPKSIDILQQLGWTDSAGALASANLQDTDLGSEGDSAVATENPLTSVVTAIDAPKQRTDVADQDSSVSDSTEATEETASANSVPAMQNASNAVPSEAGAGPLVAPTAPESKVTSSTGKNQPSSELVQPEPNVPLALYTDPGVRSVLIALIDDSTQIDVQSESGPWSIVRDRSGFPVWVHGDFLMVDGDLGTVTGSKVNARSVPIVTAGTVVGQLEDTEMLSVIDKRDDWFRVIAPARFKAWVKTSELEKQRAIARDNAAYKSALAAAKTQTDRLANASVEASNAQSDSRDSELDSGDRPVNDNEWLFSQAANTYTLQLASFDDADKIREFESRAKFINNPELHRFTALGKGIVWTYYLYGAYPDRDRAQDAKVDIGQKLAWIRNFGLIQQNRCVAWKTQLPTPKELNRYCVE